MNKFPKFVSINGGCHLRHTSNGVYYRDAGHWEVQTEWVEGKLLCSEKTGHLKHLFGQELKECTLKEWQEDNSGYINDDILTLHAVRDILNQNREPVKS